MSGKGTPFGAFLDSTLDRIEEGIMLAAIAACFAERGDEMAKSARPLLTVVGSYMVSYTRARAEALGVDCKVGIASRAGADVVILSASLLASGEIVSGSTCWSRRSVMMTALTVSTTFQRVLHVRRRSPARRVAPRQHSCKPIRRVTGRPPAGSDLPWPASGRLDASPGGILDRKPDSDQRGWALPDRRCGLPS